MLSSSKYKKSIGKNGYTFFKSEIGDLNINKIKKDLTVIPRVCQNYTVENEQVEPVILYQENKEKIYIPRYYAINKYGLPQKTKIQKPLKANLNFSTTLRSHQTHIVDCYTKNLSDEFGGGGIICAGCGVGKTVISLYISSYLKVKTLVIVHKEFLMNQWIERIKEFTDASVGIIQQNKIDIEDNSIINTYDVDLGPTSIVEQGGKIYVARTYYDENFNAYYGSTKIDGDVVTKKNYGSGVACGGSVLKYNSEIYRSYDGGIAPLEENLDISLEFFSVLFSKIINIFSISIFAYVCRSYDI